MPPSKKAQARLRLEKITRSNIKKAKKRKQVEQDLKVMQDWAQTTINTTPGSTQARPQRPHIRALKARKQNQPKPVKKLKIPKKQKVPVKKGGGKQDPNLIGQ